MEEACMRGVGVYKRYGLVRHYLLHPFIFCMTTPESITVSLDTAKKLKEAGWQHETYFDWYFNGTGANRVVRHPSPDELRTSEFHLECPAPTAEEILRRLPPNLIRSTEKDTVTYALTIKALFGIEQINGDNWQIMYYRVRDGIEMAPYSPVLFADTLANAAAACWIYLKENNLLPS